MVTINLLYMSTVFTCPGHMSTSCLNNYTSLSLLGWYTIDSGSILLLYNRLCEQSHASLARYYIYRPTMPSSLLVSSGGGDGRRRDAVWRIKMFRWGLERRCHLILFIDSALSALDGTWPYSTGAAPTGPLPVQNTTGASRVSIK